MGCLPGAVAVPLGHVPAGAHHVRPGGLPWPADGTRSALSPVETLLEFLSAGMTIEEVLADYPDLERDDILAALEFGALAAGRRRVVLLGAA